MADARCLIDGGEIVEGDSIRIQGRPERARITGIDHATRSITVNRSLTWTAGAGVSLSFEGNAPDIGAFEYTATATNARRPQSSRPAAEFSWRRALRVPVQVLYAGPGETILRGKSGKGESA